MGCGSSFVKYVLFFCNLVFAFGGLAMLGLGIAALLKYTVITNLTQNKFAVAPWLFIVVGALVFIIAFFGCCGAVRESHCMIVTYAVFLLVIIIVQVVLAILVFVYVDDVDRVIRSSLRTTFEQAKTHKEARETFNSVEIQLACCGVESFNDYVLTQIPDSCCSNNEGFFDRTLGTCTVVTAARRQGCAEVVTSLWNKAGHSIAIVAIVVALVEVVGAIFALCLANSIRNMDRRSHY